MDTEESQNKCIICGSVTMEGENFRKRSHRLLRLWKYECAETVCCILFKHKIRNRTLLNHFRKASYCGSCQQGIRDINFAWKLQKSLKAKIKGYAESTKKLIKINYDKVRSSSQFQDTDSERRVFLNDYGAVVTMVYREACDADSPDDIHSVGMKIEVTEQVKGNGADSGDGIQVDDYDDEYDSYLESPNCDNPNSSSQGFNDLLAPNNSVPESLKGSKISCKRKSCRRKFLDELEMETHFLEKHTERVDPSGLQGPKIPCPKCDKLLRNELYLKDHIQRFHDDRPSCKFCGKLFADQDELAIHCSSFHQAPNPFSCAFCDVQCLSIPDLKKHTSDAHPDPERHKCRTCGKVFVTLQGFLIHKRLHETDTSKLKKCEFCGKLFPNKHQLSRHVATHNTTLNFLCATCGKAFKTKKNLSVHLRVHDPNRTFSCIICAKSFKSLAGCRIHETSHTGIKPHTCSRCGKSFLSKYNMLAHEKIHTGDYQKRVRKPKQPKNEQNDDQMILIVG